MIYQNAVRSSCDPHFLPCDNRLPPVGGRQRQMSPQQQASADWGLDWRQLVSNPLIADLWGGDLSATAQACPKRACHIVS